MRPNKFVHPVGGIREVLPRPEIQAPQTQDPTLAAMMKLTSEAHAAQAKTDAKHAKTRLRFLLTNPERRSTREKENGMVRLHQCAQDMVLRTEEGLEKVRIGKLSRCDCEYVTRKDADSLDRSGQGRWIDGDGRSHMQLLLTESEWDSLWCHREYERQQRLRARLDKKHEAQRQETFERKKIDLIRRFHRLRETQGLLEVLVDDVVLGMLQNCKGLEEMFTGTALYAARQMAFEYWDLVMDRENLHEEAGKEVVLVELMKDLKHARENPDPDVDPEMDISGLGHSSGVIAVYHAGGRGDKPVGSRFKFTTGGFSTVGNTDDQNTNVDHIREAKERAEDGRCEPDGHGPEWDSEDD